MFFRFFEVMLWVGGEFGPAGRVVLSFIVPGRSSPYYVVLVFLILVWEVWFLFFRLPGLGFPKLSYLKLKLSYSSSYVCASFFVDLRDFVFCFSSCVGCFSFTRRLLCKKNKYGPYYVSPYYRMIREREEARINLILEGEAAQRSNTKSRALALYDPRLEILRKGAISLTKKDAVARRMRAEAQKKLIAARDVQDAQANYRREQSILNNMAHHAFYFWVRFDSDRDRIEFGDFLGLSNESLKKVTRGSVFFVEKCTNEDYAAIFWARIKSRCDSDFF